MIVLLCAVCGALNNGTFALMVPPFKRYLSGQCVHVEGGMRCGRCASQMLKARIVVVGNTPDLFDPQAPWDTSGSRPGDCDGRRADATSRS